MSNIYPKKVPNISQVLYWQIDNKLKFEKPVRQTAFQKLQSVQSIVIFFNFVRPSLPFLDLQRCLRFRLLTQRRQKRLLQYAFENLLARLIQF